LIAAHRYGHAGYAPKGIGSDDPQGMLISWCRAALSMTGSRPAAGLMGELLSTAPGVRQNMNASSENLMPVIPGYDGGFLDGTRKRGADARRQRRFNC
jgi:hypothetical protein